ncbi:MAG: type III-A CRISPR-associated protein Csm2 [Candidatus Lokiarchaeota archaeon]|nr:type III-A CRISPR-associated protein Csm2 [Candidatus Lokiarchaeota archaeon]
MPRRRGNRGGTPRVVNDIMKNAESILKMEDIEKFVSLSETFGGYCAKNDISTSQIRGIFQVVKRLPENYEESKVDLNLLRPKLAYQTGRFDELKPLAMVIDALIKKVGNDETLKGFKEFFEAIIAYHKAYGGD